MKMSNGGLHSQISQVKVMIKGLSHHFFSPQGLKALIFMFQSISHISKYGLFLKLLWILESSNSVSFLIYIWEYHRR